MCPLASLEMVYWTILSILMARLPGLLATAHHRHASQQSEELHICHLPHRRPLDMGLRTARSPDERPFNVHRTPLHDGSSAVLGSNS
ncbi:hypothetical protein TNCV_3796641 [Trichonephila clavipes]|nr:hypothetical protein TNCV_3796641 [Trichonephila clavipes]